MISQKTLVGTLALSVTLNAFLLGFVVARGHGDAFAPPPPFMHEKGPHGGPHGGPDGGPFGGPLADAAAKLPEAYRAQVQQLIRDGKAAGETHIQTMHTLFGQMTPLLTAPTFDPVQMKQLFAQIDAEDLQLKENMSGVMIKIATLLPDEARIAFFKQAQPPHPFGPEGPGKNNDAHGDGILPPPR